MHCRSLKLPDGSSVIVCGDKREKLICFYCGGPGLRLCDFPVAPRKTCDRAMCNKCSVRMSDKIDYCRDHKGQRPAALGTITIANILHCNAEQISAGIYIGRAIRGFRESPLSEQWGQPREANEANQEEYRRGLWGKIKERGPAYTELVKMRDKILSGQSITLLCWCRPLSCHGDVIKKAIEWMVAQKEQTR